MNDRFKFRVWYMPEYDKPEMIYDAEQTYDNRCQNKGSYHHWYFGEILEDKDCIVMQCTGLKDKNGTLIYEGDIIKYAEFDWSDFSFKDWETDIAQVIYGANYDNYYPAFDLKDTDFDGTNAFSYIFNEGWTVEVIGNIYENKELVEYTECQKN